MADDSPGGGGVSVWSRLAPPPVTPARDTGWQTIQTAATGLVAPGPMDPIQSFRVRRIEHTVLVDLAGLKLDQSKPGLRNLGALPRWAVPTLTDRYFWVNDAPGTLHPSVVATFQGGTLYWVHQVQDGRLVVNPPAQLAGGFEFTTTRAFPKELLT